MAVVSQRGRPDLFITFTCNPKWPEIQGALQPGEVAEDRFDIATRIFKLKLKALQNDICPGLGQKGIFGRCVGRVHCIEFQKRGLPHAHLLIIW